MSSPARIVSQEKHEQDQWVARSIVRDQIVPRFIFEYRRQRNLGADDREGCIRAAERTIDASPHRNIWALYLDRDFSVRTREDAVACLLEELVMEADPVLVAPTPAMVEDLEVALCN